MFSCWDPCNGIHVIFLQKTLVPIDDNYLCYYYYCCYNYYCVSAGSFIKFVYILQQASVYTEQMTSSSSFSESHSSIQVMNYVIL